MESIQATTLYISLFTSGASAIGVLFLVYNHFRNPDISNSARLGELEKTCPIKHDAVDRSIFGIKESLKEVGLDLRLVKDNHLKHIEDSLGKSNERLATLEGKMDTLIGLMRDKR